MDVRFVETQKVLSPTNITLADFVVNPYRGCGFGCCYCYAQVNKSVAEGEFGQVVTVKVNAPEVLERELQYRRPKRVLLGSTTECFQYIELEYGVTGKILEILNQCSVPYTILTKSHLVTRYLDLIEQNPNNEVYFTFNCADDEVIRCLEHRSPTVAQRLTAIESMRAHDIQVRAHVGPFIPGLSQLDDIFPLVAPVVDAVDVEVYHQSMGNFEELLCRVETGFGRSVRDQIAAVYADQQHYEAFAQDTRQQVRQLKQRWPECRFYVIVPQYNGFYTRDIIYDRPEA